MRGSSARALLPALAVLALVGIVAIAATGTTETGSAESRPPATTLLDIVFSLGIVAVALGGILLVYGLTQRKAIANEIALHGRFKLMYPTFIAFMVLLVVGAYYHFRNWEQKEQIDEIGERVFPNAPPEETPGSEITTYEPSISWIPIAAVLGLALLAIAAYLVADRRRRGPVRRDDDLAGELALVLDDTLDDLRAEADPRRAVIAAYARLERVLGAHGLARRPAQTPEEYLASVLERLDVDEGSARRLTTLFGEAKFSQHEVDEAMKDEAIEALVDVRDDLRRAAEAPPELVATLPEGQPA